MFSNRATPFFILRILNVCTVFKAQLFFFKINHYLVGRKTIWDIFRHLPTYEEATFIQYCNPAGSFLLISIQLSFIIFPRRKHTYIIDVLIHCASNLSIESLLSEE